MGDRANIGVVMYTAAGVPEEILWMYNHSGGNSGICKMIVNAIQHVGKHSGDDFYGTRAFMQWIFSNWDRSMHGVGVSLGWVADNEHSLWVVDVLKETATLYPDFDGSLGNLPAPKVCFEFDQFVTRFGG